MTEGFGGYAPTLSGSSRGREYMTEIMAQVLCGGSRKILVTFERSVLFSSIEYLLELMKAGAVRVEGCSQRSFRRKIHSNGGTSADKDRTFVIEFEYGFGAYREQVTKFVFEIIRVVTSAKGV